MENSNDQRWMAQAVRLAWHGQGRVEPNPMVGCVVVQDNKVLGQGWHQEFGGPHAEAHALMNVQETTGRPLLETDLSDATLYVTLEPCCHQGKTPPCCQAVIDAGIGRVVIGTRDPFPKVDGGGIANLKQAGIDVTVGVMTESILQLNAPYLKLLNTGRPWVIAKWAMTLDGKIASRTGHSQWISSPASRSIVHEIRGRVDAVMVGRGTAKTDDPLLTARPAGVRTATRIVIDSEASLSAESQLAQSIDLGHVLIAVGPNAPYAKQTQLKETGCEVLQLPSPDPQERLRQLLEELGKRKLTNLLVEGGGQLLGSLLDSAQVDEAHVFVAPKIVGGQTSPSPVGGIGLASIKQAACIVKPVVTQVDQDIYVHGHIAYKE